VEKLKIKEGTYIFTVVTMGGLGQGSIYKLASILKQKKLCLEYGRGIRMTGNYIIKYNPALSAKIAGNLEKLKF
jgi:hypothetical protein